MSAALPPTPYRELRGVGPGDLFQQARRAVLRASSRNHDRGAERYVVVLLALHNLAGRPARLRVASFGLVDARGDAYPAAPGRLSGVAVASLATPFDVRTPAHGVVERVLTYRVPARARHLALLGPGLARVRLNV